MSSGMPMKTFSCVTSRSSAKAEEAQRPAQHQAEEAAGYEWKDKLTAVMGVTRAASDLTAGMRGVSTAPTQTPARTS